MVLNQLHSNYGKVLHLSCWYVMCVEFLEYPLFVCVFVCLCVCMCVYVCVLGCNVLRLFRIIFIYFCTGCDNVVEMISYRVAACMHVSSGLFLRQCIRHCIRVYVKVRNGIIINYIQTMAKYYI